MVSSDAPSGGGRRSGGGGVVPPCRGGVAPWPVRRVVAVVAPVRPCPWAVGAGTSSPPDQAFAGGVRVGLQAVNGGTSSSLSVSPSMSAGNQPRLRLLLT